MKYSVLLYLIVMVYSCGNQDPIELNKQAMECFQHGDLVRANRLLNQAIELDSHYLLAYQNKLMVLNSLGEKAQLLQINKKLLELTPNDPNNLVRLGIMYELQNDSATATNYFLSADSLFKIILDTLNQESDPQFSIAMNRAQNLKLLGNDSTANELLVEIRGKLKQAYLQEVVDFYISMSKQDFIKQVQKQSQTDIGVSS